MKQKRKQKAASSPPVKKVPETPAVRSGKEASAKSDNPWLVAGIGVFLAVMVWLVYGQTLHYEFVNYDDNQFVYGNATVLQGLTGHSVAAAFRAHHMDNWIPVTTLSHVADYQFYGLNAGGHHLTNMLLHAVTAILLFLMLRQMTGALWRSALVAALFAIHPLGVESVAWVTERKDILSGLFFVLTLWAYVNYARSKKSPAWYVTALCFFALGLMSKPMLVTVPFVLLLLDYWPLRRFQAAPARETFRRLLVEKIPFLALALAACAVTIVMQQNSGAVKTLGTVSAPMRIENAFVAYAGYLGKLFWPTNLAILYPRRSHWPLGLVIFSVALLVAICGAAIAGRQRFPFALTGWFWFVGMLVPVIGIVQVGDQAMADRYVYLPQIGLYLALIWLMASGFAHLRYRSLILGSLSAIVLTALVLTARQQVGYWQNSETLWKHALACTRDNLIAHYDYGNYLLQKGQTEEAISQYQDALNIDSHNAVARNNLGTALLQKGQTNAAIGEYQQAIRDDPGYILAHVNLGNALLPEGQVPEAIAQYQAALKIDPSDPAAQHNLGKALLQAGQVDDAISEYREEIKNDPDYAIAYYNLGDALFQKGQVDEAIGEYQEALKLKPDYSRARINLGIALLQKGQVDDAISQYREALKTDPDNAAAHDNLGNALLQEGRLDEVISEYEAAIKIEPGDAAAHNNLAAVWLQKGEANKAADQYLQVLKINPSDVGLQNAFSHAIWTLATSADASHSSNAVAWAQEANQLVQENNPVILRVLAAAYAQSGDFANAIGTGQRAIAIAQAQQIAPLVNALEQDMAFYKAGVPVRAQVTNTH